MTKRNWDEFFKAEDFVDFRNVSARRLQSDAESIAQVSNAILCEELSREKKLVFCKNSNGIPIHFDDADITACTHTGLLINIQPIKKEGE